MVGDQSNKKRQLLIEGAEKEIIEKIKKSEVKNNEIVKAVEEIKVEVKVLRNDEWQIEDDLMLKEKKDICLSYVKSTHSKNKFPQWCCHYNIFKTSSSFL